MHSVLYSTDLVQDSGYRVLRRIISCRDRLFDRFLAYGRPEWAADEVKFWCSELTQYASAAHLGKSRFICNTAVRQFAREYPTVKSFVDSVLPPGENGSLRSELSRRLLDRWALQSKKVRRAQAIHRLESEIITRLKQGWYMVFETLDVRPEDYVNVFSPSSTAFSDYIRRVRRIVGRAKYGSFRKAEAAGEEYFSYFAVIERGSENGRLHFHVLLFMADIPDHWKVDPNSCGPGTDIQLVAMKDLWRFGFGCPKPVRFSPSDPFGKLGWKWPTERDPKGRLLPVEAGSPLRLARYVSKYVVKSQHEKGHFPWRMRMSRGLGLQLLNSILSRHIDPLKSFSLSQHRSSSLALRRLSLSPIPLPMLRRHATRKWLQAGSGSDDIWAAMLSVLPRRELLELSASLTRRKQSPSWQSTGATISRARGLSKASWPQFKALVERCERLSREFRADDGLVAEAGAIVKVLRSIGCELVNLNNLRPDASAHGFRPVVGRSCQSDIRWSGGAGGHDARVFRHDGTPPGGGGSYVFNPGGCVQPSLSGVR